MQEHDWESFVDALLSDDTRGAHAQNVQSPLSVVCEMPPAYYCQPLINLPPQHPVQNVQAAIHAAYYYQSHLPVQPPLLPPASPTPLARPPAPPPTQPAPPPPPPPSPLQQTNDRVEALKEEARAKIRAATQRKTKRCDKEKLNRAGRVIVKCPYMYGARCRFLHKGDHVRTRTPPYYVIDRLVNCELAHYDRLDGD